jgi:hypoxanthine phosphoribosyltransferase
MTITGEEAQQVLDQADLVVSAEQVAAAVDQLAESITAAFENANPVVLCVMNGALIPAGMLLQKLTFPLQIDYCHATRYGDDTHGGELIWTKTPSISMEDREVLVLDDILDEGVTLHAIAQQCLRTGASKVSTAVLVEKAHNRKSTDRKADFVGLEVADRFVFGAGMDYKGYWRNLPAIYAINA